MKRSTSTEPQLTALFLTLAAVSLVYGLTQSLVLPILPLLQGRLHTSQNATTWILTAYLLSASICTPIIGRVGDIFGKRRTAVVVLSVVALGSILSAVASSIYVMIISRAIQGAGGALMPLAFSMIRDTFPARLIGRRVGFLATLAAVGGGLGLVLAGPIVDLVGYQWLFWVPAAASLVLALAVHRYASYATSHGAGRISIVPAALLSSWLVALLIAVSEGSHWGWASAATDLLLVASAVLLVLWVAAELRARAPLIDMRMMRRRAIWTANVVAFLFGAGMYSVIAFVPQFLETPSSTGYGFGASITTAGLLVLPFTASMFVFGTLSGSLSFKFGTRSVLLGGSMISIPGCLLLALGHSALWQIGVATLVIGAGLGLAFSAMTNIVVQAAPIDQVGAASGMNANIRTVGGAIGAAAIGSVITSRTTAVGLPANSAYTLGFVLIAGAMVLAALACCLIPGRRTSHSVPARQHSAESVRR
jgi:MFS family permease